jgi:integrase/recombinase XerD
MRVSLYVRHASSRKYEKVSAKQSFKGGNFPSDTIFVLRYVRDGKRCFETLKDCPNLKAAFELRAERELDLLRGTVPVSAPRPATVTKPMPATPKDALMLDAAIDKYVAHVKAKALKTADDYRYSLQEFYKVVRNMELTAITEEHLDVYAAAMRCEGLEDRTIHNRIGEVVTFLRWFGIKNVSIRVKYVEKKVRAYRPDELASLFSVTDEEETLLYQFFLTTGAREQEVMFAEWSDIDFVDALFTVKAKKDWKPKDYEEREIPIPDFLVAALKARMLRTKSKLIFPTKEGKPDGHFLRRLQAIVKRAGIPGQWGLHKFRKSYATLQHRDGVDARTIQKRLGHSDLETTLAYLEGEESRSDRSRRQVNQTFAAFA